MKFALAFKCNHHDRIPDYMRANQPCIVWLFIGFCVDACGLPGMATAVEPVMLFITVGETSV